MSLTEFVNVFQGNGAIDLPEPQGVAATWHFIKALTGNTHPGAARPFGKLTACCYSAGYSLTYNLGIGSAKRNNSVISSRNTARSVITDYNT